MFLKEPEIKRSHPLGTYISVFQVESYTILECISIKEVIFQVSVRLGYS